MQEVMVAPVPVEDLRAEGGRDGGGTLTAMDSVRRTRQCHRQATALDLAAPRTGCHTRTMKETSKKPYGKFALMIGTSTLVMFGLMYLNTYAADHVFFSETRAYMALVMGASMAIIMLLYMLGMYPKRSVNAAILIGGSMLFAGALWLVRSQATVDDVSYMKAMIPHHSIAILTSERANLADPRVRKLADEIIEAQRSEIAEMKALIADLDRER